MRPAIFPRYCAIDAYSSLMVPSLFSTLWDGDVRHPSKSRETRRDSPGLMRLARVHGTPTSHGAEIPYQRFHITPMLLPLHFYVSCDVFATYTFSHCSTSFPSGLHPSQCSARVSYFTFITHELPTWVSLYHGADDGCPLTVIVELFPIELVYVYRVLFNREYHSGCQGRCPETRAARAFVIHVSS